jgi:hypothetical protein
VPLFPQLAELYKKYEAEGFHIVGLECQGSDEAAIQTKVKAAGATFQITVQGDLKGSNVTGIPHGFLFGADGKLIGDKFHGKELEEAVKEALKNCNAAMAGPGPYVKLAAQAAQVKAGQNLGAVLKLLRTKKDSKDEAEAKEAAMMLEALSTAAQGRLDRALAQKETQPVAAVEQLDKLALLFAGDEIGEKAKTEAANLKKDPKVKKEIEAAGIWKQIEATIDKLRPVGGEKNPKSDAFRRTNMAALQQIMGGCQALVQRYPGTAAAAKAEETMALYK